MSRFLKTCGWIVAACGLVLGLSFLGGSMAWMLGGAFGLDIDGVATVTDRPLVAPRDGWSHYGGDEGGSRYSSASQITPGNVNRLQIAWSHSTHDMTNHPKAIRRSAAEGTAILFDGKLIICTPFNNVIALDPATGAERWRYDPQIKLDQDPANQFVCRGIEPWRAPPSAGKAACSTRVYMGTNDARLIALDAKTGTPCDGFGDHGQVVIDPGMDLRWPGEFQITSPPVIVGNTVIVGSAISDNIRRKAPSGAIRAYDVATGAPKWTFDPIPRTTTAPNAPDWKGPDIPVEGHANAWGPMAVDSKRGLVFLPTSSPSPDFFGGMRPGDNRYANSVVALNAETGAVVWSFQTVHHDVWDYDIAAQPGLYSVWKDGRMHDVVAQVTKMGLLFVLDRETGKPFLPIEERAVPQGAVSGEALSPTQPFPVNTPPIVPSRVKPEDAFGITWFDKRACAKKIREADTNGLFTPPSVRGALIYPFTGGGANWGGAAFDPRRNLLVINMSNIAHHIQLIPAAKIKEARRIYHDTEVSPQKGTPYGIKREVLMSPLGLPCTAPPWGVIAGVDLASGKIVWRSTLGTTEDLAPIPAVTLGTPNLGGPIVTAGGLVFIGATMDNYLRAFDVRTGAELWKGRLPAGPQATPMTYEWQGKQYVVIYAGGHGYAGTKHGDQIIAFALGD